MLVKEITAEGGGEEREKKRPRSSRMPARSEGNYGLSRRAGNERLGGHFWPVAFRNEGGSSKRTNGRRRISKN